MTMRLLDRLQNEVEQAQASAPSLFIPDIRQPQRRLRSVDSCQERFQGLKRKIQDVLLSKIDDNKLEEARYAPLLAQVDAVIDEMVQEDHLLLTEIDRNRLIEATPSVMLGLGPLEPLLQDNDISDV